MKLRTALLPAAALLAIVLVAAAPDPAALVRRLADASGRVRNDAARDLLELGASAEPALRAASASSDPETRTRARALLALVKQGGGAEIRAREADGAVRDALRTPGGLDAGSPCDVVVAALVPESSGMLAGAARRMAVRGYVSRPLACALARHATAESLAAVGEFVRDERTFPSGGLAAAREIDTAFDAAPERADSVRGLAKPALAALVDAMQSFHPATRRAAVALYGALAGTPAVAALDALDPDAGVRAETARVMGRYAPAESAASLRRMASDADAEVREAALTALCRVPGVPHPETAVANASDASAAVRAAAACLLGREATPETFVLLETLATDPSDRVRAAARRSLLALR